MITSQNDQDAQFCTRYLGSWPLSACYDIFVAASVEGNEGLYQILGVTVVFFNIGRYYYKAFNPELVSDYEQW